MKRSSTKHALIAGIAFIITCVIALTARSVSAQQTTSIPVILNYAGNTWIDQNGEIMEDGAAEKFLENNPKYAREILYLNGNQYYATGLQNEVRSEAISELNEEYVTGKQQEKSFDSDRDALMCAAILEEIVINPSADDAFYKLITHLQSNGARKDVEALQKGNVTTDESTKDMARHIFFGMLAKNYDSGYLDEVCGASIMGDTSPQIPAILLADQETWLDQNGNVMDTERARFFLINNKEYAQEIIHLNNNPYYLPWREGTHDNEIIDLFWNALQLYDTSKESYYATRYAWVMRDIKNNPPSIELLSEYRNKLTYTPGAIHTISKLIEYIENDSSDFIYANIPRYVFWNAVAKATEAEVFENIGE